MASALCPTSSSKPKTDEPAPNHLSTTGNCVEEKRSATRSSSSLSQPEATSTGGSSQSSPTPWSSNHSCNSSSCSLKASGSCTGAVVLRSAISSCRVPSDSCWCWSVASELS